MPPITTHLQFPGYEVRSSICMHSGVIDLHKDGDYLASYRATSDLLLDLALKWKAINLPSQFLDETSGLAIHVPLYRGSIKRWFDPINQVENYIAYEDYLTPLIDFFSEQEEFCRKNEHYFEADSASIERFDLGSKAFQPLDTQFGKFPKVADLIIALKKSTAVEDKPIIAETGRELFFDVFISKKSSDYRLAKPIYDYLTQRGHRVFLSEESLPNLGSADYMKEIDRALESASHLIVVTSSVENVLSS